LSLGYRNFKSIECSLAVTLVTGSRLLAERGRRKAWGPEIYLYFFEVLLGRRRSLNWLSRLLLLLLLLLYLLLPLQFLQ
jgi:hypothetical protein